MQGCYIFDKLKRGSSAYESFRTTDLSDLTPGASGSQDGECATIGSNCDSHFGEAHLLRPLTVGYADTFWGEMDPFGTYCQAEDSYPWLPCTQEVVTDPSVGPENAFADTLHELTGDTIVVIKFCISGSSVVNLDQFNVPSWNPTSTNPDSYMPTMLDTYLDQGIQQAINLGNTLGQEVYFCGIASLIGTSDTRNADQAIIHRTSYGVCMDTIRDFCALQTHGHTSEEIPYLLLQSPAPPGLSLAGKRNFKVVRLGQYSLSISKPNVTMIDTEPILQLQGIHSDAAGYSNLGIEMAYWAWGRGEAPTVRL
ncbi:MAG: hypothetical protein R3F17_09585 [Planctomycetota bacterium]